MSRFRSSLIAAGLLAALAACDEAAAPKGTPGDLQVRAYVDRDASGTFDAAIDSGLAGVQVTVTPEGEGATPLTQATATGGVATFEDLAPGRYSVAIAGGQPAGAVLTTNPSPSVAISFQGAVTGSADFRYAFLPLVVSGRIYRDDNGDGDYDQGIDTPGAGLFAVLKRNVNNQPGATVDSVVADTAGLFTFARVAPGSYFVRLEQLPTFDYGQAGAVRPLVVGTAAPTPIPAVFQGSLVLPIGTARNRPVTANVEVEGYVTVPVGNFPSGTNSELWIQDATGGISVFAPTAAAAGLNLGKRVRVRGVRSDFSGQEQIGTTAAPPTLTILPDSVVQAPQIVTGAQALAKTGFEGELVTVTGFTVDSTPNPSGTGGYTVRGTAADGTTLRIRVQNTTVVPKSAFVLGTRYAITGVLTENNNLVQIKPRGSSDIAGPTAIATVRTQTLGTSVLISGVVTSAPGQITVSATNSEIWIQDATGGIAAIYPTANAAGIAIGDRVEVSGALGAFNGQLQIGSTGTPAQVTRIGAGTAVTPLAQTGTQVNARTAEGQLVQVTGWVAGAIPTGTGAAFSINGTTPDGQTVQVRIAAAGTGITRASFTQGATYTITGLLSQFNGAAQIKPRQPSDVALQP